MNPPVDPTQYVDRRDMLKLFLGAASGSTAYLLGLESHLAYQAEILRRLCRLAAQADTRGKPNVAQTPEVLRTSGYLPGDIRELYGTAVFGSAGQVVCDSLEYSLSALEDGFGGTPVGLEPFRLPILQLLSRSLVRNWPVVLESLPAEVRSLGVRKPGTVRTIFKLDGVTRYKGGDTPSLTFGQDSPFLRLDLPALDQLDMLPPVDRDGFDTKPIRVRFNKRSQPIRGKDFGLPAHGWSDHADSLVFPVDRSGEAARDCMVTTPNRPANAQIHLDGNPAKPSIGANYPVMNVWLIDPSGMASGRFSGYHVHFSFTRDGQLIGVDAVQRDMVQFLCVAPLLRSTLGDFACS